MHHRIHFLAFHRHQPQIEEATFLGGLKLIPAKNRVLNNAYPRLRETAKYSHILRSFLPTILLKIKEYTKPKAFA